MNVAVSQIPDPFCVPLTDRIFSVVDRLSSANGCFSMAQKSESRRGRDFKLGKGNQI